MKTALFTNFTDNEFVGYWDGKAKKFAPGQQVYMPDYLARHFAKHLANRELLRRDTDGNLVYKDGEKFTSPKRPDDVPVYKNLFEKAYHSEDEDEQLGSNTDDIDAVINSANKNKESAGDIATSEHDRKGPQNPNEPQVIIPPDFDEEEEDESAFQGKPVDSGTVPSEINASGTGTSAGIVSTGTATQSHKEN